MARERANRDYTVGYCKPPRGTRFKKGQSGNPKGRRKGVPNLSTLIITIMEEPVIVNEGGKRKAISKAEAMMKQLANRALTGDHRAAQLLINMMQLSENRPDAAEAAAPAEADRETMQHVIARMRRMARQGSDGNTDADRVRCHSRTLAPSSSAVSPSSTLRPAGHAAALCPHPANGTLRFRWKF